MINLSKLRCLLLIVLSISLVFKSCKVASPPSLVNVIAPPPPPLPSTGPENPRDGNNNAGPADPIVQEIPKPLPILPPSGSTGPNAGGPGSATIPAVSANSAGHIPAGQQPVVAEQRNPNEDMSFFEQTTAPVPVPKKAMLGGSYPTKIKVGQTKTIRVFVSVSRTGVQIEQDMRQLESNANISVKKHDSIAVFSKEIKLYDSLAVSLKYDTADFKIEALRAEKQKIDPEDGATWEWNVKAISPDKSEAPITIMAQAITPRGTDKVLGPWKTTITISFDFMDMVNSWIRYLGKHPEYTFPSVVVPIVVALYKRRSKKKEEADAA